MGKTVRIPLVGVPHSRLFSDATAEPAISALDQRFINIIFKAELNPVTGQRRIRACKRPGLDTGTTVSNVSGSVLGACSAVDTFGSVYGFSVWASSTANNIRVQLGTSQSDNASTTSTAQRASRPALLNVDGTPQFYFHVHSASSGIQAFVATAADPPVISAQTDGDLPETTLIGGFAALDGYLFIATIDGAIYNSDLNNDTSWTSTSFIESSIQQFGRGVFSYKDKIGLFTTETIEFYENVGNATGSPLQRVDQLTQRGYGIAGNTDSAIETSRWYLSALDTVFWINSSRAGQGGVFMLDGFRPKKISTPDVDFWIGQVSISSLRIAGTFQMWGMNYLAIHCVDSSTDYLQVYCFELGTWATWESPLLANNDAIFIVNDEQATGETLALAYIANKYHYFDTSTILFSGISYTDEGSAYTATIRTRNLDFDTRKKKRINRLTLIGNDPQETSTCTLSASSDDFANFTAFTARSMNLTDFDGAPTTTRLGAHRKLAFRITNSTNAAMELEAIELDMDELSV